MLRLVTKTVFNLLQSAGTLLYNLVAVLLLPLTIAQQMICKEDDSALMIKHRSVNSYKYISRPHQTMESFPMVVKEMREAFDSGISLPVATRLEQLKRLKLMFTENEKEIVSAIQKDLGRPDFEAIVYDVLTPLGDIDYLINNLHDLVAPERKGMDIITFPGSAYTYADPLGLVLVIGTWNYPIMLSLLPVAGAIAGGNCVVLKPCVVASHSAKLIAELTARYLDPRIVSVVGENMKGDRETTALLLKERFDHIFFTGSPSVGKVIMRGAAEHLTPCTLELGGKNPVFVAKCANVDLAAKRAVWGRMLNAGQQCIAPDYVLVEKEVADEFFSACKKYTKELYGHPSSDDQNIGRIVGDKQMKRLLDVLGTHGGEVICGGTTAEKSRYISPTVLKVSLDSPSMQEETFGPLLLVVVVDDINVAIAYVNEKPKPLSLYIFASDTAVQEKIVRNTHAGGVTVNGVIFHAAHPDLPFGGIGDSGMGSYHGKASFETFVHRKPVLFKANWPWPLSYLSDPFFLYPPFSSLKLKIIRFLFGLH